MAERKIPGGRLGRGAYLLVRRYYQHGVGRESAALAYYRWCLAEMSGSSLPHIGAAALVNRHTLAAAKALCEEYLAAAAEYIASGKFTFRQVRS